MMRRARMLVLVLAAGSLPASIALAEPPPLSAEEALGKAIFSDTSLSVPPGQSCASCHVAAAGFTFPDSKINQSLGVAPGATPGRFGKRAVPAISYSAFTRPGPVFLQILREYAGGQFWDGHATDLEAQAKLPPISPNEMNNSTNHVPDPALVVSKIQNGPNAEAFKAVYGQDVFTKPTDEVYALFAKALATYERSYEVSPFSSKYDAWKAGKAQLTDQEMLGLRLFTGSWTGRPAGAPFPRVANCIECHGVAATPSATPDLFTNTSYSNVGVPRNPDNPFYTQTDQVSNPLGYNPLGEDFVDYGLGVTFYTELGLPPGNVGEGSNGLGDFLGVNGRIKAPSVRNVDRRPSPDFVKAYMHNGVFKSLEQVVHFYNTRNHTTMPGEVINFENDDPYAGLIGTPLWPPPEYINPETLENAPGDFGQDPPGAAEPSGTVGNIGLTSDEEAAIVAFLRTLSDGYFDPVPTGECMWVTAQPVSHPVPQRGETRIAVASSDPDAWGYIWRRNGVILEDETTSYININDASEQDEGEYVCTIIGDCGAVTTNPATLWVCRADYNIDGAVDDADVEEFIAGFELSDPRSDITRDDIIDLDDFFAFFNGYDRGC